MEFWNWVKTYWEGVVAILSLILVIFLGYLTYETQQRNFYKRMKRWLRRKDAEFDALSNRLKWTHNLILLSYSVSIKSFLTTNLEFDSFYFPRKDYLAAKMMYNQVLNHLKKMAYLFKMFKNYHIDLTSGKIKKNNNYETMKSYFKIDPYFQKNPQALLYDLDEPDFTHNYFIIYDIKGNILHSFFKGSQKIFQSYETIFKNLANREDFPMEFEIEDPHQAFKPLNKKYGWLKKKYLRLRFRYWQSVTKAEIKELNKNINTTTWRVIFFKQDQEPSKYWTFTTKMTKKQLKHKFFHYLVSTFKINDLEFK